MATKEIKNWEWIKSVEVQYMGFLTQYLGTATDSKGFVELMKQLRLDEVYSPSNSKSITRILYNRYGNDYLLLIDREIQTRN